MASWHRGTVPWERVARSDDFVIERRAIRLPKPAAGGGAMTIPLRRWRVRAAGTPGEVLAKFRSRKDADEFVAEASHS